MPNHPTGQYRYRWHDGSYHSRPEHGPAASAAVAQPAAPPAPAVGQHFSPDSIYNAEVDSAERKRTADLGDLDASEAAIKFDFGIEDPTNPNSRVAALRRAYLARGNATINGADNQLYAGSTQRAIERNRRNEEFDMAATRRAYEGALAGIRRQRADVNFNTEQSETGSFRDAIDRMPAAPGLVPPAAPPAPGGPQPISARRPVNPQQQAFAHSQARTQASSREALARAQARARRPRSGRR